jgi:hypothetical protein
MQLSAGDVLMFNTGSNADSRQDEGPTCEEKLDLILRATAVYYREGDSADHYNLIRDIAAGDWLSVESVAEQK